MVCCRYKIIYKAEKDKDSKKLAKQQTELLKSDYSKSLVDFKLRLIDKFDKLLKIKNVMALVTNMVMNLLKVG